MDNLYVALALIVLGLVLMAAELFLPSGGLLTVLSLAALVVGVSMAFVYDTSTGLVTLAGLGVVMPFMGFLWIYLWPRTRMGKRMVLSAPEEDGTVAGMPVHLELEQLRGRFGRTLSALRPSGVTDFDGRRIDTISEGELIEPGRWVRCVEVKAGRVIVREVDGPPKLADLETASFD